MRIYIYIYMLYIDKAFKDRAPSHVGWLERETNKYVDILCLLKHTKTLNVL